MSSSPESDFDLEKLFLPAWAKRPANENQFADYRGEPEGRRFDRRDRPGRPPGMGDGGRPRPRPEGRRTDAPFRRDDGPRRDGGPGPRREGGPGPRREGDPRYEGRPRRDDRPRREEPPEELLPINVSLVPDDLCADSLARQIRMTGRAYPLFEIAVMVLEKPERHGVTLSVRKAPDGTVIQPMFVCALDDSVWLSESEAVQWLLDKHFTTFYQPERTQIEAPKGTYTFVAQCGMSGVILGPPNYHGYQEALRKLHTERFARMPFEMFKSRVRIVRDEAVVKQWIEEQSWRTEFVCLNLPEPLKLSTRDEVEKHFRATHLANLVRQVETVHLSGPASRQLRQSALARLIRSTWEQQRRFPIQVATVLSQQFASRNLQFFKVNRTLTHVAVARPHYLDLEATPVSEGIRRIVEFINAHPKCTRRHLVPALAPRPAVAAPPPATDPAAAPASTAPPEPTAEETQVIADLHWLVHQGHVIEFANGPLETAKKPLIKPPKPEPVVPAPASAVQGEGPLPAAEPITASSDAAPAETPAGEPEITAEATVASASVPVEVPSAIAETSVTAVESATAAPTESPSEEASRSATLSPPSPEQTA